MTYNSTDFHVFPYCTAAASSLGILLEVVALRFFYKSWCIKDGDPTTCFVIHFFRTISYLIMNAIALFYLTPLAFFPIENGIANTLLGMLFMRTIFIYQLPLLIFTYIDRILGVLGDMENFFTGGMTLCFCLFSAFFSFFSYFMLVNDSIDVASGNLTFIFVEHAHNQIKAIGFPSTSIAFYGLGIALSFYCVVKRHINIVILLHKLIKKFQSDLHHVSNELYSQREKAALHEFFSTTVDGLIFLGHWILVLTLYIDSEFKEFLVGTFSQLLAVLAASVVMLLRNVDVH